METKRKKFLNTVFRANLLQSADHCIILVFIKPRKQAAKKSENILIILEIELSALVSYVLIHLLEMERQSLVQWGRVCVTQNTPRH